MKIIKWATLSLCVFFILYYAKGLISVKPAATTPEYLERHGLIPGMPVEISLDDVIVAVPKKYVVNVKSFGEIEKGRADALTIAFEFPKYKSNINSSLASDFKVRVELRKFKGESIPLLDSSDNWQSSITHNELGFIEYHSKNIPSGWGSVVFVPIDSYVVGPRNNNFYDRPLSFHSL